MAVIEHADPNVSVARVNVGSQLQTMSDAAVARFGGVFGIGPVRRDAGQLRCHPKRCAWRRPPSPGSTSERRTQYAAPPKYADPRKMEKLDMAANSLGDRVWNVCW